MNFHLIESRCGFFHSDRIETSGFCALDTAKDIFKDDTLIRYDTHTLSSQQIDIRGRFIAVHLVDGGDIFKQSGDAQTIQTGQNQFGFG